MSKQISIRIAILVVLLVLVPAALAPTEIRRLRSAEQAAQG